MCAGRYGINEAREREDGDELQNQCTCDGDDELFRNFMDYIHKNYTRAKMYIRWHGREGEDG